jgi:methyl-accepting chemotaxis protein
MRLTIRTQLFGLTTTALTFVAAVGAAGYWGITRVEKTTAEVAATGGAIRNHVEAPTFVDMTREDISAAFHKTGQDQQDSLNNLALHSQVLATRITSARDAVTAPELKTALNEEVSLAQQYLSAIDAFSKSASSNPSKPPDPDPCFQLYQALQAKIEDSGEQLEAGAKRAELSAIEWGARAGRIILLICGISLLMLCLGSFALVRRITRSLCRLTQMIQDIAEGEGDVTRRLEVAGGFGDDELGEVSRLFNVFMDKLQEILREVVGHTSKLAAASQQMLQAGEQITVHSGETAAQSNSVSRATQQVSQNLNSLSIGAGEMTLTIQSIATNAQEAARVASTAVDAAQTANASVTKLGKSSEEIGEVIKVITSIAKQTNLLALNATIEAARAGEAGKGFAVVANEVKELAKQTAKATEDIGLRINAIQMDTKGAVEAIVTVGGVINKIHDISATIASAVEEQGATTNEMTRNATEAATGASDISVNIGGVAQAADGTLLRAQESQKAAQELTSIATQLGTLMRQFKIERNDRRYKMTVAVKIRATDAAGHVLEQEITTVDISRRGAHLKGVRRKFAVGSEVSLARPNSDRAEKFTIMWVGEERTPRAGQIGVSAVDPSTFFWDDLIDAEAHDKLAA